MVSRGIVWVPILYKTRGYSVTCGLFQNGQWCGQARNISITLLHLDNQAALYIYMCVFCRLLTASRLGQQLYFIYILSVWLSYLNTCWDAVCSLDVVYSKPLQLLWHRYWCKHTIIFAVFYIILQTNHYCCNGLYISDSKLL